VGDGTKIEWSDATWNCLIGCSRTSPGCDHCYAIGVVHRAMSPQHVGMTVKPEGERVDWTGEVRLVDHLLDQPIRWKRPRRIFVNSLSDVFHESVDVDTIARIFAVMASAPHHSFQLLTKRSKRMRDVLSRIDFWTQVEMARRKIAAEHDISGGPALLAAPPWVWLGVSIENDRYTFRADHLRDTPAAVRWVSAEPLLGPLPSLDLTGIAWLVAGGESGPGGRPMHPDWVRDLRDRCLATACPACQGEGVVGVERPHSGGDIAETPVECSCRGEQPGTAFLFKQWGTLAPWIGHLDGDEKGLMHVRPDGTSERFDPAFHGSITRPDEPAVSGRGGAIMEPGPKSRRVLDGRTWDEYPETVA
jgi:protein gp37